MIPQREANPLRYRGYYWDSESGFYYLQSRYYDPQIGRFINADQFASTGQDFIGYNMFAYCGNNPVNNVDSHGNSFTAIIGGLVGGAIAGAAISAVSCLVSGAIKNESVSKKEIVDAAITGAVTGAAGAAIGMISIPTGAFIGGVEITTNSVKALGAISVAVCVGLETNRTTGAIAGLSTFAGALIPASGYGFIEDAFANFAATLFTGTPAELISVTSNFETNNSVESYQLPKTALLHPNVVSRKNNQQMLMY